MPVFEKAPARPADTSSPAQAGTSPSRTPRRPPPSGYEGLLARLALLMALVVVIGIWWLGAYSTLRWLDTSGVSLVAVGLAAWALPIGVTILESGTIAARSRLPWLWLAWAIVLVFDIVTTAIGLLLVANGHTVFGYRFATDDASSQAVAGILGAIIALVPEPAARAIIRELWR